MSSAAPAPYPLLLEPILLEKVWGGRRLERFGRTLPSGKLIGESWEVADLGATNASGAGGGAMRSVIANGPLAGRTLHDAIELWGDDLIPRDKLTPEGAFPLLVKLLDARENLSVQVHPSPAYIESWHRNAGLQPAPHLGGSPPHLKTECWYILDAEPGSVIYKGVKPGTTPDDLREAIARGTVPDLLEAVPARRGDMHLLPSGTVHALGAGVLVAEIQTPSDTTFRVYDWGRTGRELHVEEALACIDFEKAPPPPKRSTDAAQRTRLVDTAHFTVDLLQLSRGDHAPLATSAAPIVLTVLEGRAKLRGDFDDTALQPGQTTLIPAITAASARLDVESTLSALASMP